MKSGGAALRILVVEDDKTIASFVSKGLRQAGYAVNHASNAEDGLEFARGPTPHLRCRQARYSAGRPRRKVGDRR